MIYTNLSNEQLKQTIQTNIKIHQSKQDTIQELFNQIDKDAKIMSNTLNRPFHHCKLALLWIENTLKENR